MKTKDTNMQESQAVATLPVGRRYADAIGKVRDTVSAIKANPAYAATPELQQAAVALSSSADALDQNLKALRALRAQESALLVSQILLAAAMRRSVRSAAAAVTEVAAGSADGIRKWGLDVASRTRATPTDAPPEGLRVTYGHGLAFVIRWNGVRRSKGYAVQIGDASAQVWGASVHTNHPSYVPTGFALGQQIAVRVAVYRTTGVSAFSDPLVVVVR